MIHPPISSILITLTVERWAEKALTQTRRHPLRIMSRSNRDGHGLLCECIVFFQQSEWRRHSFPRLRGRRQHPLCYQYILTIAIMIGENSPYRLIQCRIYLAEDMSDFRK